jgi:hypothetical protein
LRRSVTGFWVDIETVTDQLFRLQGDAIPWFGMKLEFANLDFIDKILHTRVLRTKQKILLF